MRSNRLMTPRQRRIVHLALVYATSPISASIISSFGSVMPGIDSPITTQELKNLADAFDPGILPETLPRLTMGKANDVDNKPDRR